MPIQFEAVSEYLDHDGISLPIAGKNYIIAPPDALLGLEVTHIMTLVVDAIGGADISSDPRVKEILDAHGKADESYERRILGPALDEMLADKVPWPMVQLAFQTTMVWIAQGAESAARYWASGGGALGKAPGRKRDRKTHRGRQGSAGSKKR